MSTVSSGTSPVVVLAPTRVLSALRGTADHTGRSTHDVSRVENKKACPPSLVRVVFVSGLLEPLPAVHR